MLVQRIEENSKHIFYNSRIGVSDWIIRNDGLKYEIQVTSAYQNYCYFTQLRSDKAINIRASLNIDDYKETKNIQNKSSQSHKLQGLYIITAEEDTKIIFNRHFQESMRSLRILQEGGLSDYEAFTLKEKMISPQSNKTVNGVQIKRPFGENLLYETELSCHTGIWYKNERDEIVLELPPGKHHLSVQVSINGMWTDEDLSPFSDHETDLLNAKTKELFTKNPLDNQNKFRKQLQSLLLLSRKTKMLAGGPRFFTYFGRDTLISIALLSGVVISDLTIQGIRSVLQRISLNGEIAHEETIGEFSTRLANNNNELTINDPFLEYNMVDDDFLLPAVIRHFLEVEDHSSIKKMLKLPLQAGKTGYALLSKNLYYCIERMQNGLIPYLPGVPVGDWRDSLDSQDIQYSYELNLGLAPYFIGTYKYLLESLPLLKKTETRLPAPESLELLHKDFIKKTAAFKVELEIEKERTGILSWLNDIDFTNAELSVLEKRLDESLAVHSLYNFYGLALREDKSVIKIQHNDTAFNLLFGTPGAEDISEMLIPFETFFPIGLKTDAGILVSNPVFCSNVNIKESLTRSHYHGLVIWPLMHNILYHGLKIQLERFKQPEFLDIRTRMNNIMDYLTGLDVVLKDFSSSELLTFSPHEQGDIPLVFGAGTGSLTESNPIQLWSSLGFTRSL